MHWKGTALISGLATSFSFAMSKFKVHTVHSIRKQLKHEICDLGAPGGFNYQNLILNRLNIICEI